MARALGSYALAPISTLIADPLATAIGTSVLLAAGGVTTLLLTVAVLCLPEVRGLQRADAGGCQVRRLG